MSKIKKKLEGEYLWPGVKLCTDILGGFIGSYTHLNAQITFPCGGGPGVIFNELLFLCGGGGRASSRERVL